MITLSEILRYLSNFSTLVPLVLLLTIRKKWPKVIYILAAIVVLSFLSDMISFVMASKHIDTSAFYNTYFIIQFFLLLYFYNHQIANKKLIYFTIIIFLAFFIFNTIFFQPFTTYQNWLRVLGSLIFIGYSVAYFRKMLKNDETDRWMDNPPINPFRHYPFWINAAVFYYFAFNIFLFIMRKYVAEHAEKSIIQDFWAFHNFNNIMKNFLFAIAVIVFKRKEQAH
jgi:hypothetical protein